MHPKKKKKKKKKKQEKEVEREPKERINIIYTHLDVIKSQFLLYSSAFEEVLFFLKKRFVMWPWWW
jgi:hypothetical protein